MTTRSVLQDLWRLCAANALCADCTGRPAETWKAWADALTPLIASEAGRALERTEKRYVFDDSCEPCITTRWCSWKGGCLAERMPPSDPQTTEPTP